MNAILDFTSICDVEDAFGSEIDYAQLRKIYGNRRRDYVHGYHDECIGTEVVNICGNPKKKYASTSLIERQNLTLRMSMRRFTRKTNAFSKKKENLEHALALHYVYYNFARIHQTLRATPAMEAGLSDHVWDFKEILDLLRNKKSIHSNT